VFVFREQGVARLGKSEDLAFVTDYQVREFFLHDFVFQLLRENKLEFTLIFSIHGITRLRNQSVQL
jgi:hypothetical protein